MSSSRVKPKELLFQLGHSGTSQLLLCETQTTLKSDNQVNFFRSNLVSSRTSEPIVNRLLYSVGLFVMCDDHFPVEEI